MRFLILLCVLSCAFAQKRTFFLLVTDENDKNNLKNLEEKLAKNIEEELPTAQTFKLTSCEVEGLQEREVQYLNTHKREMRKMFPVHCTLETDDPAEKEMIENYFKNNKNVNSWELSKPKTKLKTEKSLANWEIACIAAGISAVLAILALFCWCRISHENTEDVGQREPELSRPIQPMGISYRQLKSVLMRACTRVDERTINETLEYLKLGEPFTDDDIKCIMNHLCIDFSKFSQALQRDLKRIQQSTETTSEIEFMSSEKLEFHLENLEQMEIRDGLTMEKLKNLLKEFKWDGDFVESVVRELKLNPPYSLQQVREIFSHIQAKEITPKMLVKEISSVNTAVLDEALKEFNFEDFNPEDLVNQMMEKDSTSTFSEVMIDKILLEGFSEKEIKIVNPKK